MCLHALGAAGIRVAQKIRKLFNLLQSMVSVIVNYVVVGRYRSSQRAIMGAEVEVEQLRVDNIGVNYRSCIV